MKIEVVPRFHINGRIYTYNEFPKEKAVEVLKERADPAAARLQLKRDKTA